ncbi:carbohydrate binding family 9 domain-containing protein [Aliifodinibius sp. S!AR15-10]|uniref:DUF5916 domain-containing protein n=1 Tax=Aliifodinibius sp. S!AR15-10 TaxID=2950437 RepID=UPI002867A8D2|nr:DUF5916 domain-containing protein [Aliifodinibius sp. S!AR15-10]MDR8390528.1 carbohydrate binding family 9 domain-containing protein [Aliifodinibius sp. S!AR15-10]
MKFLTSGITFLGVLMLSSIELMAQETSLLSKSGDKAKRGNETAVNYTLQTTKLDSEGLINLDGKLDEAMWQQVEVATDFTQRTPNDGEPATEKTEARIIYTADAIIVGARAYDSAMDSAAATLFRKDGSAYSDWFYVTIDSYNDNRTGFSFAVNPKGVRKDILLYDDDNEDLRWDAVWEAATSMDEKGWTVEMRIPLSQLRFSSNSDQIETEWGINFQRRIARKEEISFWAPTPQESSGFVSQFGTLQGIKNISAPKQLEIVPYGSTSLTRAPSEGDNPFYSANEMNGSVGADLKYGLTSDLTLTATINPDFGQVEADPAVINLSAFETYFREQRPFFLEGNEIFNFGKTKTYNTFGNPITFYSRRIGRAPQGNLEKYNDYNSHSVYNPGNNPSTYTKRPDQTTIAAAAKLSGKTRSGWSVGLLDAYTVQESSPYQIGTGRDGSFVVEPATNYLVARTKKDLNGGNTYLGGFLSSVNRNVNDRYFENFLHESAYLGGVDFEHNWDDLNWTASGTFSLSQVTGTEEAILETQKSSARYYNRVDAENLSLDPTKTSLGGFATEVSLRKSGGGNWRTSLTYSEVSPGYEVNDLGFENRADYRATAFVLSYEESDPKHLRYYEIWSYEMWAWNHDGDRIGNYYNVGSYMQFNNLWSFNFNINYAGNAYFDRMTRGGPVAQRPRDWNFNFNVRSDQTKPLSFNFGGFRRRVMSENEFDDVVWFGLEFRPTTFIQLEIEPEFGRGTETDQYVTAIDDPLATGTYGTRYVFADIDQTFLSTNIRLDWTFTPNISLQLYARPYISSGNFYNYKEFTTPRWYEFAVYGQDQGSIQYSEADEEYTVDPDGSGAAPSFTFEEQDYNFRSIQGNTVFRWEYKPGAALFLVWQHDRSNSGPNNDFRLGRDFSRLFGSEPTNVFLIKLSYWLGT